VLVKARAQVTAHRLHTVLRLLRARAQALVPVFRHHLHEVHLPLRARALVAVQALARAQAQAQANRRRVQPVRVCRRRLVLARAQVSLRVRLCLQALAQVQATNKLDICI
jgi:hypothetical protein